MKTQIISPSSLLQPVILLLYLGCSAVYKACSHHQNLGAVGAPNFDGWESFLCKGVFVILTLFKILWTFYRKNYSSVFVPTAKFTIIWKFLFWFYRKDYSFVYVPTPKFTVIWKFLFWFAVETGTTGSTQRNR